MSHSPETENKQLKTLLNLVVRLTDLLSKYKQHLEGMRTNCTCGSLTESSQQLDEGYQKVMGEVGQISLVISVKDVELLRRTPLKTYARLSKTTERKRDKEAPELIVLQEIGCALDELQESLERKSEMTSKRKREETSEQRTIVDKSFDEDADGSDLLLPERNLDCELNADYLPLEDSPKKYALRPKNSDPTASSSAGQFPGLDQSKNSSPKQQKAQQRSVHANEKPLYKPFACTWPGCDFRARDKFNLEIHVRRGHTGERPFECPQEGCDKKFSSRGELDFHEKTHKNERLVCSWPECGKTFLTDINLKRHESEVHQKTQQNRYACSWPGCDKSFKRTYHLKLHVASIHDKQRFKCDYLNCGKEYCSQDAVKQHKLSVHFKEKPFACSWPGCDYRTTANHRVNTHMTIHLNVLPFECQHEGCGKKFRQKRNLKLHEFVHQEQRHYVCSWPGCEAEFRSKLCYTTHLRNHEGVKPYVCDWPGCEFRAANHVLIKNHRRRVHENIKKFKCTWPGCEWEFFGKHTMQRHYNRKHRQKVT